MLYAVKSRASYTEIGNKKDYISCCDFKFHAILRSSDNTIDKIMILILIYQYYDGYNRYLSNNKYSYLWLIFSTDPFSYPLLSDDSSADKKKIG